MEAHGYPMDRSLTAMVEWRDIDEVVLLSNLSASQAVWLTPNGKAPSGLTDGAVPSSSEDHSATIVTPVAATATRVFRGDANRGDGILLAIGGGVADGVELRATDVTANLADVLQSERVLVGGRMATAPGLDKPFLDPVFLYRETPSGFVSLMPGTGSDEPFDLRTLVKSLTKRVCAERGPRAARDAKNLGVTCG
jgi:hypothetical protein